jgi:serine/threonine protein kinase
MDLLTGADLRYYIKKRIILTEGELSFLVACVSSALHHMHSKGVLHRDVKPENVVFDSEGFPYLTDFGVSYVSSTNDLTCTLSSGTKQYLAPEVFSKTHEHGPASDFWALGVMTYEVMYGRRPFDKHVNREFIHYVERECSSRSRSCSSARGNTTPRLSPVNHSPGSPGSPGASSVALSGAVSLANTLSPPLSIPKGGANSLSGNNFFPVCEPVPARAFPEPEVEALQPESAQDGISGVKVPVGLQDPSEYFKLPRMASLAETSAVASLLRKEALKSAKLDFGKLSRNSSKKYSDPGVPTKRNEPAELNDAAVNIDAVRPFDCHMDESNAPHAIKSLSPRPVLLLSDEIDANFAPELENRSRIVKPPISDSLCVPIPSISLYHECVTPLFKSFLQDILEIRPQYRLGGTKNYDALMHHPWFAACELNWTKIEQRKVRPPFVPNKEQIQFDMAGKFEDVHASDRTRSDALSTGMQRFFDGYHYAAQEYFDLFPSLAVHHGAAGRSTYKCSK